MANVDTIKAIEDNITTILAVQGFKVEDLSVDPDAGTTPLATIIWEGEDFEYNHGEKPLYNELKYTLAIRFSDKAPATTRDRQAEYAHKLRSNITVAALNTDSLAASKLVSKVSHEGYVNQYEPPVTRLNYSLRVRYREI